MNIRHGLISADSHVVTERNAFLDRMSKTKFGERIPQIKEVELGIKKKDQDINVQVLLYADVDHTDLLEDVFKRYVIDDLTAQQILRGAERVSRHLAQLSRRGGKRNGGDGVTNSGRSCRLDGYFAATTGGSGYD